MTHNEDKKPGDDGELKGRYQRSTTRWSNDEMTYMNAEIKAE